MTSHTLLSSPEAGESAGAHVVCADVHPAHPLELSDTTIPAIPAFGPVPAEADGLMTLAAIQAQGGDRRSRDALYVALIPKITHITWQYIRWARKGGAWDIEDVRQEAFVVFAEVLRDWPGSESFLAYFLTAFPGRLARAVRRLDGRLPRAIESSNVKTVELTPLDADAAILLMDLAASFPEPDRTILRLVVGADEPLPRIAVYLDLSIGETRVRWRAIRSRAQRLLRPRHSMESG